MSVFESKVAPWSTPDPFTVHFPNGGKIDFYKDGRTVGAFSNPDEAAKEFVKFIEQNYRAHILEAERRAEQRVRAEIGRDSERLDWLDECCIHAYAPKQYQRGIGCGVCLVSHRPETDRNLRAAIDAAREVGCK